MPKTYWYCLILVILVGFGLTLITPEEWPDRRLRIVIGAALGLFGPGFVWSYAIFRAGRITLMERLLVSLVASILLIAVVPYALNQFGFPLSQTAIAAELLVVTAIGIGITFVMKSHHSSISSVS